MSDKLKKILDSMSVEEKIDLCEGKDYWRTRAYPRYDIPSVMMSDGPHGLRKQPEGSDNLGINKSVPAVCFPTAAATACSWDAELLSEIGRAIGEEARANGVSLVLGPGLNIKRNPLCGRNFEYFSEDPYLSGKLAAAYVNGQKKAGVGSCLKHYLANSQEYKRFSSNSVLDERTLHEIYLTGFEIAVKESSPAAVMSSYNIVNGEHVGDSEKLLNILRRDWGWKGMVVTDWGAMNSRVKGFKAGCDLMMPGGSHYGKSAVKAALKKGELKEEDIDDCAQRVLNFVENASDASQRPCEMEAHHELARIAAEQSAVLLKNEGALPLRGKACLIGHMAKELRYQGVGSSHINPYKLSNPVDFMELPFAEGCTAEGYTNDKLIAEAVALAKSVRTPVVFAGLTDIFESEGFDREHMKMPEGHARMIEAVAEANPNTVVVLMAGAPVEAPWIDKVNALLYMALPGEAGGEAINRLLTGKANPCGRLAETWPLSYDDVVTKDFYGKDDAEYREGIFVGYRYYDSAHVPVRFPFGCGLSYTSFEYSELSCDGKSVSVTVKNTGEFYGGEVVQLYVLPPEGGIFRPARELKGFEKVFLMPDEEKRVTIPVNDRSFAVWHEGKWLVPRGEYTLQVGGLEVKFTPDDTVALNTPEELKGTWYETLQSTPSAEEWHRLLGFDFESRPKAQGEFDMDSSLEEIVPYSWAARRLYKAIELVMGASQGGRDYSNPAFKMMMSCAVESSVRNLAICGGVPEGLLKMLIKSANKKRK
ncbi:MAG: glycoside hydrolase family 3 C-terminal domain-containing protein [Bacillota bacterium]|nr:glycoside hydrolase family 3 C-terminal domain-containing protein [Bacillota bacterium]